MMPHFDTIIDVLKCHDTAADLLVAGGRFTGWEEMLEDLNDTFPKGSVEVLEDQVRVGLRDCTTRR